MELENKKFNVILLLLSTIYMTVCFCFYICLKRAVYCFINPETCF